MVPENDLDILRIRGVTRPRPGKREEAIELCKMMQNTSKSHDGVRDYQWYTDPVTGELVIWESYESLDDLVKHNNPYYREYLTRAAEVVRCEVYAKDEPATRQVIEGFGLVPVFLEPVR